MFIIEDPNVTVKCRTAYNSAVPSYLFCVSV